MTMKMSSVKYYFVTAFHNLIRNRLMATASILTVSACIFMLITSYCIASNVDNFLQRVEDTVGVTIIISDYATVDDVNKLQNAIYDIEYVNTDNVKFVSSEQALKDFMEDLGDDGAFLAGFENDNPLPRSFEIQVTDIANKKYVVNQLENLHDMGIESINHMQEITDMLLSVNTGVRIFGVLLIIVLGFLSIVIIMNTIKITVNTRKNEINIMKYVGATDWFIRWPFILEGTLIGLLGAGIPLSLSWLSYVQFTNSFFSGEDSLGMQDLFSLLDASQIFPFLMPIGFVLGIFIGVTGSVDAIRKHLKV